jgi:hypothetical protein
LEFSMEKVLKNHFFNKFHGMFRGKSLSAEKIYKKSAPGEFFFLLIFIRFTSM